MRSIGAQRARNADRNRIDDRAVKQPAAVDLDRLEHARQSIRGADCLGQFPATQPDLVPAANLGRDAGEADGQILDPDVAEFRLKLRPQPLAADQAASGEGEIEQPENAAPGQRSRKSFKHVELAGRVAASDQRTDRRADNHVGPKAQRIQLLQGADMSPAPRCPGAEHDADSRRAGARPVERRIRIAFPVGCSEHCHP